MSSPTARAASVGELRPGKRGEGSRPRGRPADPTGPSPRAGAGCGTGMRGQEEEGTGPSGASSGSRRLQDTAGEMPPGADGAPASPPRCPPSFALSVRSSGPGSGGACHTIVPSVGPGDPMRCPVDATPERPRPRLRPQGPAANGAGTDALPAPLQGSGSRGRCAPARGVR